MRRFPLPCGLGWLALLVGAAAIASARDPSTLRLVPFPKEVLVMPGSLELEAGLVLEGPAEVIDTLGGQLADELRGAGLDAASVKRQPRGGSVWRLGPAGGVPSAARELRDGAGEEDYQLDVTPSGVTCRSPDRAGLYYGMQTFRQLVRANRTGNAVPCCAIRDWPSIRWRCYQDDMTRGPSSRLETLEQAASLGSELKMNVLTYYMECQYAFTKHPAIGPKDGSLTAEELRALVEFAAPRQVEILGNQQSFGHFQNILKHKEYAHLGEAGYILSPAFDESYELLDDLYSEVLPLLPFPLFNVCCDETWALGQGASKELAAKIGVGGVYVRHIQRVHELITKKYGKRMMMWGDIILQHPERLPEVPKDVVMLTWGYGAQESFEDQIIPFAKSGYEFFVCPGVSNWSRILPDFAVASTNIQAFVRDGAKHGASGVLNTAWEDDGEALNAPKWHGYAWGAECSWNAGATSLADFHRRVGAVLYGEPGDHFGQAIELLAKTHRLAGMSGMNNGRFWEDDFAPKRAPTAIRRQSGALLDLVRPAIEHLEACQRTATVNGELLDAVIFGARRMELIGQRMLDGLEAAELYEKASRGPASEAVPLLRRVESLIRKQSDALRQLRTQFEKLWLRESRPYALDWTLQRYDAACERFERLAAAVAKARKDAETGVPVPEAAEVGLPLPRAFGRRTRPDAVVEEPLLPEAPWIEATATHRRGFSIGAGPVDRTGLPIEIEDAFPSELAAKPVRASCSFSGDTLREVPAQLLADPERRTSRLVCFLDGTISRESTCVLTVYAGLAEAPSPLPSAVTTYAGPDGTRWIENDKVRILLAPEGAHVYQWLVKDRESFDLTMPGASGWAGFCDTGYGYRSARHQLELAAEGPAVVRYVCTEPTSGLVKTISLYAGASWIEVIVNEPVGYYWDFDNPRNFAADGPTPGTYLFSDGATGPVGKEADGVPAQIVATGARWGIKFRSDGVALGLATPEIAAHHRVAPGAGAGGVGIEGPVPAAHFVTFGGVLEGEPAAVMHRLTETLDFARPPRVVLYGLQKR